MRKGPWTGSCLALVSCSSALGPSANTEEGFFHSGATRLSYAMDIPVEVLAGQAFMSVTGDGSVPQLAFVRDGEIVDLWKGSEEIPGISELRRLLR